MKVVMIGPFALYPLGTVHLRMVPIAEALNSRGHEISIVLPPYNNLNDSGREYKVGNVPIYNITIPKRFNVKKSTPIRHLLIAERVIDKTLKLKPEIIHIFVPTGISGLAAMLLILRRKLGLIRIPLIIDVDDWGGYGGFYDYLLANYRAYHYQLEFIRFQARWVPRNVDATTVASRTLQSITLSLGVPEEKVFYIPNGPRHFELGNITVDKENMRKKIGLNGKPTILLYTRFFEYDIKRIVNILQKVKEEIENVRLLIVGKSLYGKEEEKLLRLAKKKGIRTAIIFAGWVKYENLPVFLDLGDVAIYPFDDTLLNKAKCPGKIVQLMSLGKAIIADRVGQITEYIEDGQSGILIDPGDIDYFSQSIIKILRDRELREKLGKNAKERIWRKFNWSNLVIDVEKAYEMVSSDKKNEQ